MARRNPMNARYTQDREGGATRRGAGSAKPVTAAGASVRQPTKKPAGNAKQRALATANMSKEERKALRAKEREQENNLYTASSILCNKDEKYKKLRRYWWGLLIAAIVFTVLSWTTLSTGVGGQVASIVVLVLAYASIIGALVMDFTVVRKRRNYFRDKVNAMSKKAVDRVIQESYQERVAKEAAKKAKKEAKKAGKSAEEADAAAKAASDEVLHAAKRRFDEDDAAEAAKEAKKAGKQKGASKKEAQPEAELSPEEAAEAARKAAAAKAARDFAASKRKGA